MGLKCSQTDLFNEIRHTLLALSVLIKSQNTNPLSELKLQLCTDKEMDEN